MFAIPQKSKRSSVPLASRQWHAEQWHTEQWHTPARL
jgi:hypothetical protein